MDDHGTHHQDGERDRGDRAEKAIYQRYMGWFDANPERLWPHPPTEQSQRYVAAIGGMDRVVELAQIAFDEGDSRWGATLLDHAVFTDEIHPAARELCADTLEQLGYGAENGIWRNFFLSGATELRHGNFGTPTDSSAPAIVAQLTPEQLASDRPKRLGKPSIGRGNEAFRLASLAQRPGSELRAPVYEKHP